MNTRILGLAASLTPSLGGVALATAFITSIAGSVSAAEPHGALPQLAGVTTDLGSNASALTHWVDEADDFHVVTTIDTIVGGKALPEPDRHRALLCVNPARTVASNLSPRVGGLVDTGVAHPPSQESRGFGGDPSGQHSIAGNVSGELQTGKPAVPR